MADTPMSLSPQRSKSSIPDDPDHGGSWLRHAFENLKHDFETPFTSPYAEGTFTITTPIRWKEALGDKVCILDVNTDPMFDSCSAWADGKLDYTNLTKQAPGVFNHYAYAKIHGYQYQFWQGEFPPDRHATWLRLPAILNILEENPDCKFVVYLDTDAMFPHLTRLPIEWLLNYWDITEDTTVAMAEEPEEWFTRWKGVSQAEFEELFQEPVRSWKRGYDSKGRQCVNTGVMIVQNLHTTREMLRKWIESPLTDERGNDFARRIAKAWPAEQGVFNELIREPYLDTIRNIPCSEALGYPRGPFDAHGKLVRHYTTAKTKVKEDLEAILARDLIESLHLSMKEEKEDSYKLLDSLQARGICPN